jgi:hypothetical protein
MTVLVANKGCVVVITRPFLWTDYIWVNVWEYREICLWRSILIQGRWGGFSSWTSLFVISTVVTIVTMNWLHNTQRRLCIKAKMPLFFSADYIRFIRVNTRPYSDTFRIIPYPTKLTIDWSHWGLYNWLQGLLSSLTVNCASASQEIPWIL